MTSKDNQLIEPSRVPTPHRPMSTGKHIVAYLCIWFLVVVLVMVYFTSTGSPQAGLLEVGISAFIFVGLFHLVIKYFPLISKIFTSVIVVGFGIALICVNYHFLKVVKKDAPLEQLLVGDLLVNKIMKTIKKEPITFAAKEVVPKAVAKPRYEKSLPVISLDQLKKALASPTTAKLEVSHIVIVLAPMVKMCPTFIVEKYKGEMPVGNTNMEISGPEFTPKECESMIQEVLDRKGITFLSLFKFIREMSTPVLEVNKIQSLVSETTTLIHLVELSEPLKEGRIPVN